MKLPLGIEEINFSLIYLLLMTVYKHDNPHMCSNLCKSVNVLQ